MFSGTAKNEHRVVAKRHAGVIMTRLRPNIIVAIVSSIIIIIDVN